MAEKKSRAAARKIKDKWKAKVWYNLLAPEMFNKQVLGETPTDTPDKLVGRVTEVTVKDLTGDFSTMNIKLKSPVRPWTVTSVTRPTSLSGVSVGVSPRSCLLNISGARRLYHTFAFHLSLIFRAAARDFFSAMRASLRRVP